MKSNGSHFECCYDGGLNNSGLPWDLDFFKKSFRGKAAPEALPFLITPLKTIYAPASGKVVALESVSRSCFCRWHAWSGSASGLLRALCTRNRTITAIIWNHRRFWRREVLIHARYTKRDEGKYAYRSCVEQDRWVGQPLMTLTWSKVK